MKTILHNRPRGNTVSITKFGNYNLDSQNNWVERTETASEEYNGEELKVVFKQSRKIEHY